MAGSDAYSYMRRFFAFLFLACVACGPAPDVAIDVVDPVEPVVETKSGALTFRTWNVEQFPKQPMSRPLVEAIVEADPADLFAVQEIKYEAEFWRLADELEGYEAVVAEPGYYTGVGALYRPSKLDLLSVRSLFTDDDWAFPRPALFARFEVVETGAIVNVIVVHLKARLDSESQSRRKLAIEKIEAFMRSEGLVDQASIVLGDFNDELMDPAEYNVFDAILGDDDLEFVTLPLEANGAFSYISYEAMIDHVLVSSRTMEILGAAEAAVLPLEQEWPTYVSDVSDHRQVEARFTLP